MRIGTRRTLFNCTRHILMLVAFAVIKVDTFAQSTIDTLSMDTAKVFSGFFSFKENSVNVSRELIESTILPISSNNITGLLSYIPFVSRSQELSSGISIKGSGLYTSKFYFDGLPIRQITHNYGFFSGFNAQTISNVQLYDGYVPSNYNSGSGIASFTLKKPLVEKNKITATLNPYNISIYTNYKLNKNNGILASYTNSYSAILLQKEYPDLTNIYNDKFISTQHKFAANKIELNTYIYNFVEQQNASSGIGVENAVKGGMNDLNIGLKLAIGRNNDIWKHELKYMHSINKTHLDLGYQSILQQEKTSWFQYRIMNQRNKFIPGFLIENETVNFNLIDSNRTKQIINNNFSLALNKNATFNNFRVKSDFRINLIEIMSVIKVQPIYRFEFNYQIKKSTLVFSLNRFVQSSIGLANNFIPIFQDLKIPLLDINKIPTSNEVNFKYIRTSKKFDFQSMLCFRKTHMATDYTSYNANLYDFKNIAYGTNQYYGAGLAASIRLANWKINTNLTYSKSLNSIDSVNFGIPYASNQDRPIIFNVLLNRKIGKLPISIQFNAQSGRPITLPTGFLMPGVLDWSLRNAFRTRPFHHLDIGAILVNRTFGKHFSHQLNLHMYNVYLRRNVYNVVYKDGQFKELSLFPVLISIEYKINLGW